LGCLHRVTVFESTTPFTLFEYFRVPYKRVSERDNASSSIFTLSTDDVDGPTLSWPSASRLAVANCSHAGPFLFGSIWFVGRVATEAQMGAWTRQAGGSWRRSHLIRNTQGTCVTAAWRRDDGSTFLPFDPNELIRSFWTEQYRKVSRTGLAEHTAALARRGYYRARPVLPRTTQMGLRRSFIHLQARARFPRWPIETALHDFYGFLFALVADLVRRPIPSIGSWPGGKRWALVLTHDVEGATGYANLRRLLQIELDAGYRSSWNFVPENGYRVERELLDELRSGGFEIGVHGLLHDGRDVASLGMVRRRLPAMRAYARRWGASGFRSPGTLRSAKLMPLLEFDYDSSYSDTAPFEPQAGGCCSWLPYKLGDLVELPITLTQDHTVFELLRKRDEHHWLAKASFLREQHGMALMLTHPDYVGNPDLVRAYERFLAEFAGDETAWKALPRDVSAWWRKRGDSHLEDVDGEWTIVGPAQDDGHVEFIVPSQLLKA
jgi:peptidoglycan/xylan/chitin deacetylase (PgdA/CDA1 family)